MSSDTIPVDAAYEILRHGYFLDNYFLSNRYREGPFKNCVYHNHIVYSIHWPTEAVYKGWTVDQGTGVNDEELRQAVLQEAILKRMAQ